MSAAVEIFDRRVEAAERQGDFEEAAGWARMKSLAEPTDLRWVATVGLMLAKAADRYRESGDFRRAARAARQARQTMERFRYPAGVEFIDNVVEISDSVFSEACLQLGLPAPDFRGDIDPNLVGEWMNSLDGFEARRIDWARLATAASSDE